MPNEISNHIKTSSLLLISLFNLSLLVVILFIIFRHSDSAIILFPDGQMLKSPEIEYKDYVSILLTTLAVMIALGSVAFAFFAVFGYAEGQKLIERAVSRRVDSVIDQAVVRAMYKVAGSNSASDTDAIVATLDNNERGV